jgi:hypothetical protein
MALKGFGNILDSSYKDYKKHFPLFMKVSFVLYFLPTIISAIFYLTNPSLQNVLGRVLIKIVPGLFSLLLIFTIIKILLVKREKKELELGEALRRGSEHFGEGILLSIIMGLALFGLYLLFLIPGIIFSIYWNFAYYALITDNVGITKALEHSKKVVQGRWWTVFGYIFLLGLITGVISFAVFIALMIIMGIFSMIIGNLLLGTIISTIIIGLLEMLLLPFTLTFMEKFYLDLKKNTKKLD